MDSGTGDGAPDADLEQNLRPCRPGVDMGAYEFCGSSDKPFIRGDANADGTVDISDPICTLNHLFLGDFRRMVCLESADGNDSGKVDISDPIYLLNHLFHGGPAPPEPHLSCGWDATPDDLTCAEFKPCR